jgi:hypothetical protein
MRYVLWKCGVKMQKYGMEGTRESWKSEICVAQVWGKKFSLESHAHALPHRTPIQLDLVISGEYILE